MRTQTPTLIRPGDTLKPICYLHLYKNIAAKAVYPFTITWQRKKYNRTPTSIYKYGLKYAHTPKTY